LLDATSSTAEGEHKQESSKEDPSAARPKWLRMLVLFVALFIETMSITISSQLSWRQGRESIPWFHLGVIVGIVDVILVGLMFVVLANYFRFMKAHGKDKALFGKLFMMAGILLGLALEALSFTAVSVADGEHRNFWVNFFATPCHMLAVSFQFFVLIGYYFFTIGLGAIRESQTMYLHWSRFQAWLDFSVGLSLGVFMSMILSVANWGLRGGLTSPKLLSVLLASLLELASFCACTAAYLQAVLLLWTPEEAEDDAEDEENNYPFIGLLYGTHKSQKANILNSRCRPQEKV
jgi:uncharacterized integral membrane protein